MGEHSEISWCDATFNPWIGCQRVSPACEYCYAEVLATTRLRLPVWGPPSTTARHRTAPSTWKLPRAWDRRAAAEGRRPRVFCASLADVFEAHPQVAPWRLDLWELIEATPNLQWLLLTKRPENLRAMLPPAWLRAPRANLLLGTTVEDMKRAALRIPPLLGTPAVGYFLSCEPLLGPLDLRAVRLEDRCDEGCEEPVTLNVFGRDAHCGCTVEGGEPLAMGALSWVIAGGESGPHARPMHPRWARDLRDQCVGEEVPFHFKQWGEWRPREVSDPDVQRRVRLDTDGTDGQTGAPITGTPAGRDAGEQVWMQRAGKHAAGRLLDGREWNGFPQPPAVAS